MKDYTIWFLWCAHLSPGCQWKSLAVVRAAYGPYWNDSLAVKVLSERIMEIDLMYLVGLWAIISKGVGKGSTSSECWKYNLTYGKKFTMKHKILCAVSYSLVAGDINSRALGKHIDLPSYPEMKCQVELFFHCYSNSLIHPRYCFLALKTETTRWLLQKFRFTWFQVLWIPICPQPDNHP